DDTICGGHDDVVGAGFDLRVEAEETRDSAVRPQPRAGPCLIGERSRTGPLDRRLVVADAGRDTPLDVRRGDRPGRYQERRSAPLTCTRERARRGTALGRQQTQPSSSDLAQRRTLRPVCGALKRRGNFDEPWRASANVVTGETLSRIGQPPQGC